MPDGDTDTAVSEYVVVPPLDTLRNPGNYLTPAVARTNGGGSVYLMGSTVPCMTAEAAIDLGHRLVEAGIAARRAAS